MAINAGENTVQDLYWGADRVKRVYLGADVVHRATFYRKGRTVAIRRGTDVVDFNTTLQVKLYTTWTGLPNDTGSYYVQIEVHKRSELGEIIDRSSTRTITPTVNPTIEYNLELTDADLIDVNTIVIRIESNALNKIDRTIECTCLA